MDEQTAAGRLEKSNLTNSLKRREQFRLVYGDDAHMSTILSVVCYAFIDINRKSFNSLVCLQTLE